MQLKVALGKATNLPSQPPMAHIRPSSLIAIEPLPGCFVLNTVQASFASATESNFCAMLSIRTSIQPARCTYMNIVSANEMIGRDRERERPVRRDRHRHHYNHPMSNLCTSDASI